MSCLETMHLSDVEAALKPTKHSRVYFFPIIQLLFFIFGANFLIKDKTFSDYDHQSDQLKKCLKFGLCPLHCKIWFLELLLKIAYNKNPEKKRGNRKKNSERIKESLSTTVILKKLLCKFLLIIKKFLIRLINLSKDSAIPMMVMLPENFFQTLLLCLKYWTLMRI